MKSDRVSRNVFLTLAGLFVAFIAYTSWTPSGEEPAPTRDFFSGIKRIQNILWDHNFRDLVTNVLLYVPLGVFVALSILPDKLRAATWWLLIGLLVSAAMETGQSIFGRVPDALDIITNGLGFVLGYWIIVAADRRFDLKPAEFLGFDADEEKDARIRTVAIVRFVYVCVYVFAAMLPFDISVVYSKIYLQLLPGEIGAPRIILDPFYHVSRWPVGGASLALEVLALLPVAVLSAVLNGIKRRFDLSYAVFPCVLVATFGESIQLLVLSRTSDIIIVPIAITAGALGWVMVRPWFRLRNVAPTRAPERCRNWRGATVALVGYAAIVVSLAWRPVEFIVDPRAAVATIFTKANLIPFRGVTGVVDIAKPFLIFLPLGVLMTRFLVEVSPRVSTKVLFVCSGLTSIGFATILELLQFANAARHFDVTNIVLAALAGAGGVMLLEWVQPRKPASCER